MRRPVAPEPAELPSEPKRPRAVILAELQQLLDRDAPDWSWAHERLCELRAMPRQLELFK